MNSLPRILSGLSRKDAAWTCSSCVKVIRQRSETPLFRSSMRHISNSSKPRENVAPTMEQLRAPFKTKNSSTLYYTLSIILGTVAFSYGSVPMYKMVCLQRLSIITTTNCLLQDLPNYRLGRTTYKGAWSWRTRWYRSLLTPATCHGCETHPYYLQWLCLRRPALEIHTTTTRGPGLAWGNGTGILYCYKQVRRRHNWGGNV